jgi:1-acyl-sn-glycerol-3-phosphate acyltransferase
MLPLPPRWVRRVVLAPGMVAAAVAVLTTLPVGAFVLFALSPLLPGRWRALRVGWLVTAHLVLEAVLLCVMFALWVASGFGYAIRRPWFERAHYVLMMFYLRAIFAEARRVLHVTVDVEGPAPQSYTGRPLVVFCRHAGPGDSFLLAHALVNWYRREPRIVLKDTLQWDPMIDVVLNRLPSRFVSTAAGRRRPAGEIEREIGALATGLDDNDALVIFPEGGNFTAHRRARAIARLREKGLLAEAEKAERLRYVLPPRPGGVLAALENAVDADVVWVAHTGTDTLFTVTDVWRALPMDRRIKMRWWQAPRQEVPAGDADRLAWVDAWWSRIDDWIAENRGPG